MKLLYHTASKNIEISNTQKLAILLSFWRRSRGSVDHIEYNYGASLWFTSQTLEKIYIMIQSAL